MESGRGEERRIGENMSANDELIEMLKKDKEEMMKRLNGLQMELSGMRKLMEQANERAAMAEARAINAELKLFNEANERESRKRERKLSKRRGKSVMTDPVPANCGGAAKKGASKRKEVSAAPITVEQSTIATENRFAALTSDDESDKSTGLQEETVQQRTSEFRHPSIKWGRAKDPAKGDDDEG